MAQKTAEATVVTLPETRTANNERSQIAASASPPSPAIADEDVVRDILEELDRERSKRAELELKIKQLVGAQAAAESSKQERTATDRKSKENGAGDNTNIPSSHDYLAMQTQVEGYKQLVDELTKGKPAIAAAAKNENTDASSRGSGSSRITNRNNDAKKQTLPLHVVRLLEVIPWDPRAREHLFGIEEVYEWQVYDKRERKWQGNIRSFPAFFKALPVTRPKPGGNSTIQETTRDRSLLLFLAGGGEKGAATAPSKHGVLSNAALTQVLNIETGFPLPKDGATWQWIGGWRVDKRVTVHHAEAGHSQTHASVTTQDTSATGTNTRQKVDCDDDGWSYAREAQHFILNPTELAWDHPGTSTENDSLPERRIRRRKWTRQRLLVDYPYASERTQNYLKLLAHNARLSVTSSKISDQLVETKMALTETEQELMRVKEEMDQQAQQIKGLKTDLDLKDALLRELGIPVEGNGSHVDGGGLLQEHVKEIGSKISQWVGTSVRKTGEDANIVNIHSSIEGTASQLDKGAKSSEAPRFGWGKKFGGGALLEKIKQSQAITNTGRSEQKLEESEGGAVEESTENGTREEQGVKPEQDYS